MNIINNFERKYWYKGLKLKENIELNSFNI